MSKTLPPGYRWAETGEEVKPGFRRWFEKSKCFDTPINYGAKVGRDGVYIVPLSPVELREDVR